MSKNSFQCLKVKQSVGFCMFILIVFPKIVAQGQLDPQIFIPSGQILKNEQNWSSVSIKSSNVTSDQHPIPQF